MQKVALRAQLSKVTGERDQLVRARDRLEQDLADLAEKLSLARAGLLIALPHVAAPAARMLVGYALETSDATTGNPGKL